VIRVIGGTIVAAVFIVGLGLIGLAAGGSRSLTAFLVLASILFAIGMFGFLARRNAISMLMAIELMLNAVNLSIIGFASFNTTVAADGTLLASPAGSVIALLVMAVAAGEATVGLSIILAIYRNKKTPLVDEYDAMSQ
jgi:NADH:ubiquinone oxidoreductase subunit K